MADTTPITIAGETFSVSQPHAEGHTLSANQAKALNQVRAENLRNNFSTKVKAAKDAGTFDLELFQAQLDDYDSEYEFGSRSGGGGRTTDPVQAEAMSIARDAVRAFIRKANKKLSDFTAARITELAKQAIEKNPQIMDQAKARVAQSTEIAGVELGTDEPEEATPPHGKAKRSGSPAEA